MSNIDGREVEGCLEAVINLNNPYSSSLMAVDTLARDGADER
jgi:hypothetical protein